jgi:hypothetical protein
MRLPRRVLVSARSHLLCVRHALTDRLRLTPHRLRARLVAPIAEPVRHSLNSLAHPGMSAAVRPSRISSYSNNNS